MQEEIFSSKSVFIWWPKFHFNNKLNWGWRVCGKVQRGKEEDCEAGTCNPGLESLFLITTCLFYSWVCCFVSCSAVTEGLAVIAVGHQKLLPTASGVSSAKLPVTVSFSYTCSVSPSKDLLAVICGNNIFLYLYLVSLLTTAKKKLILSVPSQMDTHLSPTPKSSYWKLSIANSSGHLHLVLRFVMGDDGRICTLCFLVFHPRAKKRIRWNILFLRTVSERKTYLNKKRIENYSLCKED